MGAEKDVKEAVTKYIANKYAGDGKRCFDEYDKNHTHDSRLDKEELVQLLKDAGVKRRYANGFIAGIIIKKIDHDEDGSISWHELQAMIPTD